MINFRQLNCHVDVFTANAAKLREWRQKASNVSLLDLKRAYLHVRVQKTLWPIQTVKIGGQRYCLTRLGFGLNLAPLVVKAIVSAVLLQEEAVGHTASAYIDDIYVNEDVMPATRVREHLARFGLECKDPERLEDGARVLGLTVVMEHGKLRRKRGSMVPDAPYIVKRRAVFSLCGRLVGHFPVCGWLREFAKYSSGGQARSQRAWMMKRGTTCCSG